MSEIVLMIDGRVYDGKAYTTEVLSIKDEKEMEKILELLDEIEKQKRVINKLIEALKFIETDNELKDCTKKARQVLNDEEVKEFLK